MADYRKLRVWQRSARLADVVFKIAELSKRASHVALADQLERAAISITSNIAEGSGHKSRKEFARFVTYSIASSCELENQIGLAAGLRLLTWRRRVVIDAEIEAVRKMLKRFRDKLEGA